MNQRHHNNNKKRLINRNTFKEVKSKGKQKCIRFLKFLLKNDTFLDSTTKILTFSCTYKSPKFQRRIQILDSNIVIVERQAVWSDLVSWSSLIRLGKQGSEAFLAKSQGHLMDFFGLLWCPRTRHKTCAQSKGTLEVQKSPLCKNASDPYLPSLSLMGESRRNCPRGILRETLRVFVYILKSVSCPHCQSTLRLEV